MKQLLGRSVATLVILMLTATLGTTEAGAASPHGTVASPKLAPPPDTQLTVAQVEAALYNQYVGPDAATGYGQWHEIGWGQPTSSGYIAPVSSLTYGGDTSAPVNAPSYGPHIPIAYFAPDGVTWFKPWTWAWGTILGTTWDDLWNYCLKGALTGIVGNAGKNIALKLLARGAKVFIGPEGYAAFAFAGCLVQAVNQV